MICLLLQECALVVLKFEDSLLMWYLVVNSSVFSVKFVSNSDIPSSNPLKRPKIGHFD